MFARLLWTVPVVTLLLVGGCGDKIDPINGILPPPQPAPTRGLAKFKGGERLTVDFAAVLELDPTSLCLELGLYPCAAVVHPVALGGVEPYRLGLYQPTEKLSVTAPLAVERVAMAGCINRVDDDLTSGLPVIFDLGVGGDGRLTDPEGDVRNVTETLVRRAFAREPTLEEIGALQSLYTDIAADGASDVARDWAVLSCFTVLSAAESVFY